MAFIVRSRSYLMVFQKEFDSALELMWEQAAIGEEVGDQLLVAGAYYEISKLMETAGSWASWYLHCCVFLRVPWVGSLCQSHKKKQ